MHGGALAISLSLLLAAGCSGFKEAGAPDSGPADEGPTTDAGAVDAVAADSGSPFPGSSDGGATVTTALLVTGRSRLGARATVSFRPWRSGLAAQGGQIFWVESGTAPGLYTAPQAPCTSGSCVRKLATLTRPSAFATTATHLLIADITAIVRIPFQGGAAESVASSTEEIVNLAASTASAFWTEGTSSSIRKTDFGGATSTPISSNGTPVAMAVAGDRVFWAGVDISGLLGALQSMGVDGRGAREVSRFSAGFHAMRGHTSYLYYAKDSPGSVHRIALGTGRDEVVATEALAVHDIAVDATHAYWVEAGDAPEFLNGRVRRVAHDGKTAETLAVSVARPVAIAVSDGAVFVARAGTRAANYADGAIVRLTISSPD